MPRAIIAPGSQCLEGGPEPGQHRLPPDSPHHVGDQGMVHGDVFIGTDGITGIPGGQARKGGLAGDQRREGGAEEGAGPLRPA